MPGALAAVIVLAAAAGADLPRVVLARSVRIFILIAVMPATLTLFGGRSGGQHGPAPTTVTNSALEILATLAPSGFLAVLLTLQTGSGRFVAGGNDCQWPPACNRPCSRSLPATLGDHRLRRDRGGDRRPFRGTSLATLRRTVPGSIGSVLVALAVSAAIAAAGTLLLPLPFGQLWLAYAPGGVEAMAVMALALQLDPAFVGAHHVLRILGPQPDQTRSGCGTAAQNHGPNLVPKFWQIHMIKSPPAE